ncbi:protein Aatf [Culicoides brevitarsis]|uniref:protein Aatf n=1 Tax=Culicoides brevitarsis TaxID=469753 RepID=UPI00307BB22B
MSKKRTINDQIVEVLKPKESIDPEDVVYDENTVPKISAFDENDYEDAGKSIISEFRKRNAAVDLAKTDKKYQGEVVSRADLDKFMDSSEEEDDEGSDDDGKYATDTDDDEELNENDSEEEENEEEEEENDENEEDESQEEEENSEEEELKVDTSQILRPEAQGEKIRQGKAVKVQLQLWEKMLEMRIKSQKLLSLANSLPFGDVFDKLSSNEEFSEAISSTTDRLLTLLDKNRELQRTLVKQFPESKEISTEKASRKRKLKPNDTLEAKRAHLDSLWDDINQFTTNYTPYRNSVIQKWHDRTKIAANVKSLKNMESQSIVQKIDNILLNRNELIRKTQIYRGGYEIVGHPLEQPSIDVAAQNSEIPADDEATTQNDPFGIPVKKDTNVYVSEIYDDSDFYHQLLRELIEFKTSTSSNPQELEQKYQELHQLRNKMKKTVDTRASKGRKIRYVVHNKLVNFMAPVASDSWTEEAKTELYNSLFDKLMTQANEMDEKFIVA